MPGYYDYKELHEKALGADATQEDINALGEWFEQYGRQYWNGECYNAGEGNNLYPIYRWDSELDQGEIIGFTFYASDQRIYYEDQQEKKSVIIPGKPSSTLYRVTMQFPDAEPVDRYIEVAPPTELGELLDCTEAEVLHIEEIGPPIKRLFLDMDGTLAQFHAEENCLERMYEPGFFRDLKPYERVVELAKDAVASGVEVYILSSVIDSPNCQTEKNAWLDEHLPMIDSAHRLFPKIGEVKAYYAPGGVKATDYLLDDYNANLEAWTEYGGSAVKCVNEINHKGLHGPLWTGKLLYTETAEMDIEKDSLTDLIKESKSLNTFRNHTLKDGILTLSGEVAAEDLAQYKAEDIREIRCEKGCVLPEDCSSLFSDLKSLTKVELANADMSHVTDMREMFSGCKHLTTLDTEHWDTSNVTNMDKMFEWCEKLTALDLSSWDISKVKTMDHAFFACESLNDFALSDRLAWHLKNGVLTVSGKGEIPHGQFFQRDEDISHVIIEDGITGIGNEAFEWCSSLESVVIPDSVTYIGNGAFYGNSMKHITIPDSVKSIGTDAFYDSRDLESVTYRGTVIKDKESLKLFQKGHYDKALAANERERNPTGLKDRLSAAEKAAVQRNVDRTLATKDTKKQER